MAASKGVDGVGLALVGAGTIFAYAGIKGYSVMKVLRNVVSGVPLMTDTDVLPLTAAQIAAPQGPPGPNAPTSPTGNKAIGKSMAKGYGWDIGANWDALDKLWTRESGWKNTAKNASSGAYGIPQALPASKMPAAAQAPPVGRSDPATQIRWGLEYIKGRYGSPVAAWAHSEQTHPHWY